MDQKAGCTSKPKCNLLNKKNNRKHNEIKNEHLPSHTSRLNAE